jgi:N-acetylgalactosamine-6-sulfatase
MKNILILLLVFIIFELQASDKDRPNVIFILADDLGAGDLQCTGHPYAKTPNLDKLAEAGIRFERAYMAAAWCAPSRYGLMRGQFPARDFDKTHNLKPDEPSITKILNDAGYSTAHFGKWHMNQGSSYAESPGDFGIDEHFTTNNNGTGKTWTKEQTRQEFWRAQTTDAYVDMTIDFIKKTKSNNSSQPFYVNLWVYPTHSYIHPTPEQLEVYKGLKVDYKDFSPYQQEFLKFVAKNGDIDKAMQAYCADVTAMDKALGRLFDFLKENGLDKNTMVVFTSDNGPGPLTTQLKNESVVKRYKERPDLLNSVGSSKIYRERKISLHDGGIRVPFIVSWPQNIPKGKVDEMSVIHGVDWLPTVASACNVELPEASYDGVDLKSAFLGKEMQRNKEVFWTQAGTVAVLLENWKGLLDSNGKFELYDILKDPEEKNNLNDKYPDVASKVRKRIIDWKTEIALK